jgi:hypothetical protein
LIQYNFVSLKYKKYTLIESLTERLKESNYLQLQLSERVQLLEDAKKKKRWLWF